MDYKEFKKNITHMLQKNIYEEYTIRTENAGGNDYLHDTLIITPPSAKYGLTFQWGHLYNRFQCNCDLKAIVALIIQEIMIRKETAYDIDTAKYFNPDYVKEHISFRLIHAEQGQMILENCPHRKILDLAVVYTIPIVADESRKTVVDVLFKNDHCGMTGITEKMLYEMAYKNTQNVNPPVIVPLSHYLVLANGELDMKEKNPLFEYCTDGPGKKYETYIISERKITNGASSILYGEVMERLAAFLNSDLYLIPSSIHEMLAVGVSKYTDPDELKEMLNDVNEMQVKMCEQLSDQIYHYDKKKKQLSAASSTLSSKFETYKAV